MERIREEIDLCLEVQGEDALSPTEFIGVQRILVSCAKSDTGKAWRHPSLAEALTRSSPAPLRTT